jgi:hypothetical protein
MRRGVSQESHGGEAVFNDTDFDLIRVMDRRKRRGTFEFGRFGFSLRFLVFSDISQPSL